MAKKTKFATTLLARLKSANKRLGKAASIDALRPVLTIRRVQLELEPRSISPTELKSIRAKFNVSQAVFAALIQVSARTLQKWEQGSKPVDGAAAVLLGDMLRHPEHWSKQFGKVMKFGGKGSSSELSTSDR